MALLLIMASKFLKVRVKRGHGKKRCEKMRIVNKFLPYLWNLKFRKYNNLKSTDLQTKLPIPSFFQFQRLWVIKSNKKIPLMNVNWSKIGHSSMKKKSVDFWHRKSTLKVRIWHFLTNCNLLTEFVFKFFLWVCWFVAKNLAF